MNIKLYIEMIRNLFILQHVILFLIIAQNYSYSEKSLSVTDNQKDTTRIALDLQCTQYEVIEIELSSGQEYDWWLFPVYAEFTHKKSGTKLKTYGIWNGDKKYIIRFAPAIDGEWSFETISSDSSLNDHRGILKASLPTQDQINKNPNFHGFLKVSLDGRYFEYSDGTPFFLFADTDWSLNTSRCGIGTNDNGPFFEYLTDRKSKNFTTILMSYLNGFGDVTEINGFQNEGGHPFFDDDVTQLNPQYIKFLDYRIKKLWENGLVAAVNTTWFGKRNCFFDITWAKRVSAYLVNRFSAFNGIISLSGEYQYAMNDCTWDQSDFEDLGNLIREYNPNGKPVSVHPSSRTNWPAPHNRQSSSAFHSSDWLDHNWLQTGHDSTKLVYISERLSENYNLNPAKPVFLSEGFYEKLSNSNHVYHSRWQPWVVFLNGGAGYGYGAFGVWSFYDPDDPFGETGKEESTVSSWREALKFEGSEQMKFVSDFFQSIPWWNLSPHRNWLTVNGDPNPNVSAYDISPPHCAADRGKIYVIYIPMGNKNNEITLSNLDNKTYSVEWFNPRNGNRISGNDTPVNVSEWTIPQRPDPVDKDWALLLSVK